MSTKAGEAQFAGDEAARQRFQREAEAAAAVAHPNVVSIYQIGVLPQSQTSFFVMQFIEGEQIKTLLNDAAKSERKAMCVEIGKSVGKLHRHGIIHGDLTTSNMILSTDRRIFFVDFGLGERNVEIESMGVDMHLMRRALQSTHFRFSEECFKSVFQGYSEIVGADVARQVLEKMIAIRKRGRYASERREKQ